MRSNEFISQNPFPLSLVQGVLWHGTNAKFKKFNRPPQGIYVTPEVDWAREHYGENVIPVYANVTKLKKLTWNNPSDEDLIDMFYDRDYDGVALALRELENQGYNCCWFGGESDSMVLFGNIQIMNAHTKEEM